MAKSDAQRIQELEDKVCALKQLLLAHVAAFAHVDSVATAGTLMNARAQAKEAFARGRGRVGLTLLDMVEAIERSRD